MDQRQFLQEEFIKKNDRLGYVCIVEILVILGAGIYQFVMIKGFLKQYRIL